MMLIFKISKDIMVSMTIFKFLWQKMMPVAVLSGLVYLVFDRWHNLFLGALVLFLYFLFISAKTQAVLVNYFDFTKSFQVRLLAIFLSLISLGWFLGIFIFFNYFNGLTVFLSFFANALVWSLVKKEKENEGVPKDFFDEEIADEPPHEKISVLIYLGLLIYGFYLLAQSKTGAVIFSPWQTINPRYVWVFLLVTFLLGVLVLFSKISLKALLFFVILHSFLLHSYLPLTHDLFYGADGWRHMGAETRLMEGKGLLIPAVVGEQSLIAKSNVGVLSYANFWGTNVVLAKMLQIDLISLTKWFLPILWSIIFTILLYEIGLVFGWKSRNSLLLAWGGVLPFALQAGGSFSLPVNFGFLSFVLFFLLLLKNVRAPNGGQKNILLALGIGSVFGYLLFFILFWLSWGVMVVLKSGKKLLIIPSLILASLALPALELAAKFSVWNGGVSILAQIKQFFGNLSAVYLISGPRPHDIAGGNFLFNQIPGFAFTPNFLTQFRWWLPAFVLTALIIIVLGIKRNIKDLLYKSTLVMFVVLLTSYFLSFYLLSGERLLSRRLDPVLAFLFLILFFYGLNNFLNKKVVAFVAVAILSLAITASYALGPDTSTVSSNQLAAARYVWYEASKVSPGEKTPYCVLADTYPLLALEAVSGKEIIGGGFPINSSFAQPERVEMYKQMSLRAGSSLFQKAVSLTKSDYCLFIGETNNFYQQGVLNYADYKLFGDVTVIRYNIVY